MFLCAGADTEAGFERFKVAMSRVRNPAAATAFAQREGAIARFAPLLRRIPGLEAAEVERAERLAQVAVFRAGALRQQLVTLVEQLSAAGVQVLLLKGAALATSRYRRFGDRSMGDLDLLIDPGEAERALVTVRSGGWRVDDSTAPESFYESHQHLRPLILPGPFPARLELHVELLPDGHGPRLTADEVWQDSAPSSLAGARQPSTTHLLLHACIHFAWSHLASSGGWKFFQDVERLLSAPDFNADGFRRAAVAANAARVCGWALHLAATLGGVDAARAPASDLLGRRNALLERILTRHFATLLASGIRGELPLRLQHRLWMLAVLEGRERAGVALPWRRGSLYAELLGQQATATTRHVERGHWQRALFTAGHLWDLLRSD